MSTTKNLGLFKHDNPSTNTNLFDITKSLNENWDKIDEYVTNEEASRQENEKIREQKEEERQQSEINRKTEEIRRVENEKNRESYIETLQQRVDSGEFKGDTGATGPQGEKGNTGATGNGIQSITLKEGSHLAGQYDTYLITFTDGTTEEFQVYNGKNGDGSGDMLVSVYDSNNNGIVDNAEKVNNHTVESNVPANAKFTDTTYGVVTTSTNGLMSSSDKSKLDGIATGANKTVVDTELSSTSTNPVQNKVINSALGGKANSSHTHNYAGSSSAGGSATTALTCTGNSATATKATQDSAGQQINTTYIKGLSVSGKVITYTKGDGTTGTITTQDTNTTYSNATTSTSGLMSSSDKTKLDGIAIGANNYSLPTASSSTLGGVKTTSSVTSNSGYTACPIISGVPYYKDTNTTYTNATTSENGLMSSNDKSKLDNLTSYSTEEVRIGTWIDGKTLYRKTINTGAISGSVKSIKHNISNIDKIWIDRSASFGFTSDWFLTLPYTSTNTGAIIDILASKTTIYFNESQQSLIDSYITLCYTKTTD